jgi:hypothetical protein
MSQYSLLNLVRFFVGNVTGGTVAAHEAAHSTGEDARVSAMLFRDRSEASPRVSLAQQSHRFEAVQVRQVYLPLFQPVDAQQSRQVAHERLPVPLPRLHVRGKILPRSQGACVRVRACVRLCAASHRPDPCGLNDMAN